MNAAFGSPRAAAGISMERMVVLLGLGLLALISLNVNSATRIFTWPWWMLWRVALLIPIAWAAFSFARRPRTPVDRTCSRLLGGFVVWYVMAALCSEYTAASCSYGLSMVALCALAWCVARSSWTGLSVPTLLSVGGVLYCAASIAAWCWWLILPQTRDVAELNAAAGAQIFEFSLPRNSLLLGHWNYTAGVAVLTLPWTLASALNQAGWRRHLWVAGAGVTIVALFSAMSRGAWIGVAASGAFAVVTIIARLRWPGRRLVVASLVAVAMAVVASMLMPRIRATVVALVTGEGLTLSDVQRLNMTAVGLAMVKDNPVLGQGPGLTPRLYPRYRHEVDGGVETAFQLHNTPLQLTADAGVVGALLFGGLVASLLLRGVVELQRGVSVAWDRRAAGVSLFGYATYSLTDYQLDVPIIAAGVGATLGLLLRNENAPAGAGADSRLRFRLVPPVLVVVVLVGVTLPELGARRALADGVAAVERTGETGLMDEAALRAAELLPDDPQPLVAAAVVHLRQAHAASDHGVVAGHRALAKAFLHRALEREPNLEIAHFNLGWLKHQTAPEEAAAHFRRAVELVPDRRGVYFGLGIAHLESGRADRAVESFALELLQDPEFATSPVWDVAALNEMREPSLRRAMVLAGFLERSLSDGARSSARYAAALFAWMLGERIGLPSEGMPVRAGALVGAINRSAPVPAGMRQVSAWQLVRAAAVDRQRRFEHVRLALLVCLRREPTEQESAVMQRLVERCGEDWRAWSAAPEGREAPFALSQRSHRLAYATLAYNLDIPVPYDDHLRQTDQLVTWLLGDLFPPRGHLPTRAWLELVRELGV